MDTPIKPLNPRAKSFISTTPIDSPPVERYCTPHHPSPDVLSQHMRRLQLTSPHPLHHRSKPNTKTTQTPREKLDPSQAEEFTSTTPIDSPPVERYYTPHHPLSLDVPSHHMRRLQLTSPYPLQKSNLNPNSTNTPIKPLNPRAADFISTTPSDSPPCQRYFTPRHPSPDLLSLQMETLKLDGPKGLDIFGRVKGLKGEEGGVLKQFIDIPRSGVLSRSMGRLRISSPRGVGIFGVEGCVGGLEGMVGGVGGGDGDGDGDGGGNGNGNGQVFVDDGRVGRDRRRGLDSRNGGGIGWGDQDVISTGREKMVDRGVGSNMTPSRRDTYIPQVGRNRIPFGRYGQSGVGTPIGLRSAAPRYESTTPPGSPSRGTGAGVGDRSLTSQIVFSGVDEKVMDIGDHREREKRVGSNTKMENFDKKVRFNPK